MATFEQLESRIKKLTDQADLMRQRRIDAVIINIQGLMSEFGLTVADLQRGIRRLENRKAKRSAGISGSQRMTGDATGATTVGKNKGVKAMPRQAKYIDPDSGVTWSGVGRPPSWIRDAPSRDAFLIGRENKNAIKEKAAKK